jgi:hypothetical protein
MMSQAETQEPVVMKFIDAPLGCRFRYPGSFNARLWIKLSNDSGGLIAEYHPVVIRTPQWSGQSVCSFAISPDGMDEMFIEVVG